MGKKALGLAVALLVLLNCGIVFASGGTSYSSNVSSAVVQVHPPATSSVIVFPATARNVYIRNYDTASCWVNPKGSTVTGLEDLSDKIYIPASGSIDLIDFATDRVSVFGDTLFTYNPNASSVVVTATY